MSSYGHTPPALAKAFKRKATISGPELCRLLPIDARLLRKHIKHSNIEYLAVQSEGKASQKAFTLAQVMDFVRLCTPRR
ncbi:hypothetical protein VQ02_14880 [Methylobacterium variabile]|uniref:Uncharacterized protein n=1 Tax=Methylobacterium variabile TaxID=298794 RepID=A0A0J6STG3_9HYPH|nr:hypothetical protein VQ02_14880 [Methylobacterium variabile]